MRPTQLHHIYQSGPGEVVGLLLHGTGGNERDLLSLGSELMPGAALLSPRGNVLENGMPRFFKRLREGVFDQADLLARTHELADFVADAAVHYGFAGRPIVAVGFSNGANAAASLLLRRPGLLSRAILLRATMPFQPESLPRLEGTSVLLAEAQSDPYVPIAQARQLEATLKAAGADVTLHWSPGGHSLHPSDLKAARDWLQNSQIASRK